MAISWLGTAYRCRLAAFLAGAAVWGATLAPQGALAQSGGQTTVVVPSLGGQHADPRRRTLEAEGSGPTAEAARAAAVQAALEEAAGVYIQSDRRLELTTDGTAVRSIFHDRVVAQSNGFVERVITLRSWHQAGEERVRIRAEVVVNRLIEAMREARMPLIPIDPDSIAASLRTQTTRDESGRELLAQYLAELITNVEIRLDNLQIAPLPSDPNMVLITAQAAFGVKPDYVQRGLRLMQEVAGEVEVTGSQNVNLALCSLQARSGSFDFGPYGPGIRSMSCRGFAISEVTAAQLETPNRDWALVGLGFYDVVGTQMRSRLNGVELGAGPFLVLDVLDQAGTATSHVSTRLSTDCNRPFSTMSGYDTNSYIRERHAYEVRRGQPVTVQALLPLEPLSKSAPLPHTCSWNRARVLGNARAPEMRRAFLAIVPRLAVEQASNLRVSLSWEP
ncbi:hypothetical protein [Teichococcus vastitatis]|uniref:hypothetical protein n=1 Tax=Teichococcus vastitatis TaxID=2307076 RepID=UPI000E74DF75|nr:hypothetical protein [Pseudoroseomonas vastitatis]